MTPLSKQKEEEATTKQKLSTSFTYYACLKPVVRIRESLLLVVGPLFVFITSFCPPQHFEERVQQNSREQDQFGIPGVFFFVCVLTFLASRSQSIIERDISISDKSPLSFIVASSFLRLGCRCIRRWCRSLCRYQPRFSTTGKCMGASIRKCRVWDTGLVLVVKVDSGPVSL